MFKCSIYINTLPLFQLIASHICSSFTYLRWRLWSCQFQLSLVVRMTVAPQWTTQIRHTLNSIIPVSLVSNIHNIVFQIRVMNPIISSDKNVMFLQVFTFYWQMYNEMQIRLTPINIRNLFTQPPTCNSVDMLWIQIIVISEFSWGHVVV
jgi:hypothetical protein